MQNKGGKIFLGTAGVLVAVLTIMGIKIRDDQQKLKAVEDALSTGELDATVANNQETVAAVRAKIVEEAGKAPAPVKTVEGTQKTVVPGKTVTQTVPVTTTTKAKTSSTSSSKTTSTS